MIPTSQQTDPEPTECAVSQDIYFLNETTLYEYEALMDEKDCLYVEVLIGHKGHPQYRVCAGYIQGQGTGVKNVIPDSMCRPVHFQENRTATMTVEFAVAKRTSGCPDGPYPKRQDLSKNMYVNAGASCKRL